MNLGLLMPVNYGISIGLSFLMGERFFLFFLGGSITQYFINNSFELSGINDLKNTF